MGQHVVIKQPKTRPNKNFAESHFQNEMNNALIMLGLQTDKGRFEAPMG